MEPDGDDLCTDRLPLVRRSGIREEYAPDIVQDVFATVARSINTFERKREDGSFRAWLATITRSRVHDFLRKEQRHQPAVGGTEAFVQLNNVAQDLEVSISVEAIESPLARRAMEILRTEFEEVTWKAFYMTTVESLSPAITAERLEISLASVYQARTRVLRKLRQRLSEL